MKNFDIEKIERNTPYKIPEGFFSEMQENVLKNTIGKEQEIPAKFFKLNFGWAIAAAVALLFGLGAFFMNNNKPDENTIAITETTQPINTEKPQQNAEKTMNGVANYQILKQEVADVEKIENQGNTDVNKKVSTKVLADNTNKAAKNHTNNEIADTEYKNEKDVENLLASFTSEDLKQLSKNTEQDIYLDLYN